jgi:hypothetical protein
MKSSYHAPTAYIWSGVARQIISSARDRSAAHVSGGATGTAPTIRAGARVRSASIAAAVDAPVASPSSLRARAPFA